MVTKIYSGDEARALLADHDAPPRITYGDLCGLGVPLCVDGREMEWREDGDGDGDWICVPEGEAAMHTAAPDLAASVVHHAARADAAEAACVQLRLAVDALCEADALAEQERTRMRARIAELERLATGPRSAESDDAGLSRPVAPETLPGWDGDGREVSR